VLSWRAKFLDAGKRALEEKISGPDRGTGTAEERRLRVEANQLKLALAEATVQLRIWEKGAGYVHHVPSPTSKP
jgi:transposase